MRFGSHLVTDCRKANQGSKSHKDVESILIHYLNTYTHITATKAKPLLNSNMQADILVSNITTIDNPNAKNWHIDVTSTNPLGATNQDLTNRNALGHQPDPSAHDPRNNTLVYAAWAEGKTTTSATAGTTLQPFALETMGGHGASTNAVYYLFTKSIYTRLGCASAPGREDTEAQAQQGHLVRPASGNDCPGCHPSPTYST